MIRRAAIYIRTSSETQGEKSSPLEQETDCRRLAEGAGERQGARNHRHRRSRGRSAGDRLAAPGAAGVRGIAA